MRSLIRFLFRCVLIAGYLPCLAAGNPMLLNGDSLRPRFAIPLPSTLASLPPASLLSLHVVKGADTLELAVAAAYRSGNRLLEMQLLTELGQDAVYLLRWKHQGGSSSAHYRTPKQAGSPPANLLRRFPQSDTVPANLLFMQFRFDRPMRADVNAWMNIHIREDRDGAVEIPFAWRQRSFWLDSNRVLQLMIHPGRVKSGIHYGGPLLVAGHRYEIRIDEGLVDAGGNSLPAQQTQYIVAMAEDHVIPKLHSYSRTLRAGTREALLLRFSDEMDFSGILTGIRLLDGAKVPLDFHVELSPGGRNCSIVPERPWPKGTCSFELDSEIRDLGANTMRRHFEVRDVREAAKDGIPFRYFVKMR